LHSAKTGTSGQVSGIISRPLNSLGKVDLS